MQLEDVAPEFVTMAHRIVWASVATTDPHGRPRTRVLHPIWEWNGSALIGWVATGPTPLKIAHLEHNSNISLSYWSPSQDTCSAECDTAWAFDEFTCTRIWELFKHAPDPLGYDPAIIPGWESPNSEGFAVLKLDPWRLRVFPGSLLLAGEGEVLNWYR
ncbi:MAG: pyridoxamine 5'-phosphate oxidase family protein [Acidimicrobiales bacterium]